MEEERVFSISKLHTFENCPKMYKFKYIDGITEPFQTIEAHFGKIIHNTLEYLYSSPHRLSLNELISFFNKTWEENWDSSIRIIRRGENKYEYKKSGKELLIKYHPEYLKDNFHTITLEHKFKLLLLDKYHFTGIIDRLAKDNEDVFHVIDYKTSRSMHYLSRKKDLLQIKTYGIWTMDNYHLNRVIIHAKYLFGEDENKIFKKQWENEIIHLLVNKINKIKKENIFPKRKSGLCPWCRYQDIC